MTRRNLLFACAGFAAAMWSGCGFEFPPAPQPVPSPEPQARPVAYRIGVLDGVLADELEEGMQLVPHSGTASDKPIVIAAEELAALSAEQVTAIHAAYAANHPIVLVYAGLNDIKALQQLLGNDAFEYALPDGVPYVEIYAVDRDADGSMWQWSLFPPESTATEYSESTVQDTESGTETTQTTPAQVVSLGYDSDADQKPAFAAVDVNARQLGDTLLHIDGDGFAGTERRCVANQIPGVAVGDVRRARRNALAANRTGQIPGRNLTVTMLQADHRLPALVLKDNRLDDRVFVDP